MIGRTKRCAIHGLVVRTGTHQVVIPPDARDVVFGSQRICAGRNGKSKRTKAVDHDGGLDMRRTHGYPDDRSFGRIGNVRRSVDPPILGKSGVQACQRE